jgi:hypothetical protein
LNRILPLVLFIIPAFGFLVGSTIAADMNYKNETEMIDQIAMQAEPIPADTLQRAYFDGSYSSWMKELDPNECEARGAPIIDVSYEVLNDMNPGYMGNWSYRDYEKRIRVYKTSSRDVYCALITQEGNFKAIEGAVNPFNGTEVEDVEKGELFEGYRLLILGKMSRVFDWPGQGSMGVLDYECSYSQGMCPGNEGWVDKYFEDPYGTVTEWWGSLYRSDDGNVWMDAVRNNE